MRNPTGFDIPTLSDLNNRIIADFLSEIPELDPHNRRSMAMALGKALAGTAATLCGFIDKISQETHPLFCSGAYLDYWGQTWNVTRRPATKATGSVTVTGIDGSTIPQDTILQRTDGTQFITTEAGAIASGTATITVESVEAGTSANTLPNVKLQLTSALTGIDPLATVVSLSGGADVEADGATGVAEAFRGRLLDTIRRPPQGGCKADYETWAKAASPSVSRCWVAPLEGGAGRVVVRLMTDDATANGIPTAGTLTTVAAYLDQVRPVTANVSVLAPTPAPLNITIQGLVTNDQATKDAITAELKAMLRRETSPGGTVRISKIWEAVSLATGESHHKITSPTDDVTAAAGAIHVLGTITWA